MNSRNKILEDINAAQYKFVDHPAINMYPVPGDKVANFENKLNFFDGKAIHFRSREDAIAWLQNNIDKNNHVVFSSIPDYIGNITLSELTDPHDANRIDVCVAQGLAGVGETGSVWVTNESLGLTAAALFSTSLYLLLDTKNIVDGIHTAYRMLDLRATQYGAFYSGPSATADIEAVHITGAQGEISLIVLLID